MTNKIRHENKHIVAPNEPQHPVADKQQLQEVTIANLLAFNPKIHLTFYLKVYLAFMLTIFNLYLRILNSPAEQQL